MNPSVPSMPGVKAEGDLLHQLRQEVARSLGRDRTNFPGAQPVSFARRHLHELTKEDYYVCEKSDGIRCLMYCTNDGPNEVTYLIDRKNDYYWVQSLHFPLPDDQQLFHINTLIDGELVNDRQQNGDIQLKYLVFDCLVLDGDSLMHRTLDKRLAYFREKVYTPYRSLYDKYPEEIQYLPFIVEFKKMEFGYGVEMMFRDILPHLPHGNDGLIFTCRNTPYKFGTDEHILKWKKADENSIDFRLVLEIPRREPDSEDEDEGIVESYPDYDAMPRFFLEANMDKNRYERYAEMYLDPQEWDQLKRLNTPLDERIVECYQDGQNRWRYMRFRDDKNDANHISTVNSVIESIQDKVSELDLIRNSWRVRDAWKAREAAAKVQTQKEAEARKTAPSFPGQNGARKEDGSGVKHKLEDGHSDENGIAKRKTTPSALG
ncbi:Dcp1p-Dcp2p decapping enzyme complex alpha subunit [Agyrium rufum]|nr:Dcp1p-Dcp2p decapping enzyme complex alpha subunit [Agyrium rufum]